MKTTHRPSEELVRLHARYAAKGAGFVPGTLDECARFAAEGRLFEVDTQNRGADCLMDADSASAAIAEVASFEECEPTGWTAKPIAAGARACECHEVAETSGQCDHDGDATVRVEYLRAFARAAHEWRGPNCREAWITEEALSDLAEMGLREWVRRVA